MLRRTGSWLVALHFEEITLLLIVMIYLESGLASIQHPPTGIVSSAKCGIEEITSLGKSQLLGLARSVVNGNTSENRYGDILNTESKDNTFLVNSLSGLCLQCSDPAFGMSISAVDLVNADDRNTFRSLVYGRVCVDGQATYTPKASSEFRERTDIVSYQNGILLAFALEMDDAGDVHEVKGNATIHFVMGYDKSVEQFSALPVKSVSRTCVTYVNESNWSHQDCTTVLQNSTAVKCVCKMGSAIAVMTSYESTVIHYSWYLIICVTGDVSAAFDLITFVALIRHYKKLHKDRGFIQVNFTLSLFLFRASLVSKFVASYRAPPNIHARACEVLLVLFQYFMLTTLFWMLSEGVFLFRKVVFPFSTMKVRNIAVFHTISVWTVPLVTIVISATVGFINENYVKLSPLYMDVRERAIWNITTDLSEYIKYSSCWTNADNNLHLLTAIPIAVVVCVNLVICIWVLVVICQKSVETRQMRPSEMRGQTGLDDSMTHAKTSLVAFFALTTLLGINWIFPVFGSFSRYIDIVVVIVETAQGFAIFWIYCVMNTKVKEGIKDDFRCIRNKCTTFRN